MMTISGTTMIFVIVAVTVLVLQLIFPWTPVLDVSGEKIGVGATMETDQEITQAGLGDYDHITENEVAEYASNHIVTLDRFNVTTTGPTSETIRVIFGDVQLDELFEEKIDDWLGSQGYGITKYNPFNNGTTFLEITTLP